MSLNVGGIYVACSDRDRVVELIREYWLKRGAVPISRDPLAIEPLSLGTTAELGFIVSPPTRVTESEGPEWIAIYDSERYHGEHNLAAHLADALGTSAVIYGMHGASDIADIKGFGTPIPDLPVCGYPDGEEDYPDDEESCACAYGGDWGEIETYIWQNFPFPFLYYNQLKGDESAEFLKDWAVFGFEKIPHIPEAQYSGPDEEAIRYEADKKELVACIERGDLDRIEEIYADNERIRYVVLSEIAGTRCNASNPVTRRLIRAFSERILEDGSSWMVEHLAEVALLEDDDELFERACVQLGDRTAGFAVTAYNLIQAGDKERAYKLLRKAVSSPKSLPDTWNNLLYTLISRARETPRSELAAFVEKATQFATINPSIWHNVACIWARVDEIELALEAVRYAYRDGYDKMNDIAADDDLVALQDDPRFAKALEGNGERIALNRLIQRGVSGGVSVTINRPVIMFSFSVPMEDGPGFGRGAAAVLRRYHMEAPDGALTVYRTSGGPWEPLTAELISRDADAFVGIPSEGGVSIHAHYRGGGTNEVGEASPYAVDIEYVRFEDGHGWRSIQLCFPCEDAGHPEDLMQRFLAYAELVPYETGRCGFALLSARSDYGGALGAEEWGKQISARFYGFQPSMGWLALVGPSPLERVGGAGIFNALIPSAHIASTTNGGICIRAAVYPPVAIVNQPDDIGAMPEVVRALHKLGIGEQVARCSADRAQQQLEEEEMNRLDVLSNGAYTNNPPKF